MIRGRCTGVHPPSLTLRNLTGSITIQLAAGPYPEPGDLVEVTDGRARVLTPNRTPARTTRWSDRILNPRRLNGTRTRARVESAIREFFLKQDFLETRTPILVPCPGMEPHIRPFRVGPSGAPGATAAWLPTSPEFAMKRLLTGGLEKIFQLSPAFRDEPKSVTHHPEFTMLEWYRAYAGYEEIMRDTEQLFREIAIRIHGKPAVPWQGREISLETPWPRLRVRDLFAEHAGIDLVRSSTRESLARECARLGLKTNEGENWDDLYFKLWLNVIEGRLPADRAVFVLRYPPSQAALAMVDSDEDGSRWAKRFEAYAGGIELGNAFEELTDPVEQRRRFAEDMELRAEVYGAEFPKNALDEEFLGALEEGMPPSGGIAVGVDRLVMLMANEPEIDYTLWLESQAAHR